MCKKKERKNTLHEALFFKSLMSHFTHGIYMEAKFNLSDCSRRKRFLFFFFFFQNVRQTFFKDSKAHRRNSLIQMNR